MNRQNRNVKAAFETAMASNGMKLVDIVEPTRSDWMESLAVAAPPALLGFFTGVSWGKVLTAADIILFPGVNDNLVAAAMGFSLAYVTYTGVFRFYLLHTAAHYYAEKGEGEESEPSDGLVPTNRPRQLVKLDGRMKKLLRDFARRYPAVGTLAINRWEGGGNPFSRAEIQDVRAFLLRINAASQEGRRVELNDYGHGKLSEWAAGKFGDTPPSPEGV